MKPEINNLPAIDAPDLRETQLKKMVDGLDEMGKYAKELRKSSKLSLWLGIGVTAFFIIIFGLAFAVGGLSGIIDLQTAKRSFECSTANGINDTVRNYADAKYFVDLYSGECKLIIKGEP